jgi:hypothetical protein
LPETGFQTSSSFPRTPPERMILLTSSRCNRWRHVVVPGGGIDCIQQQASDAPNQPLRKGTGFGHSGPSASEAERSTALPKAGSEATKLLHLLQTSSPSRGKPVKPHRHVTHSQPTTSACPMSFLATAIMCIQMLKKEQPWRPPSGANLLITSILGATHLL